MAHCLPCRRSSSGRLASYPPPPLSPSSVSLMTSLVSLAITPCLSLSRRRLLFRCPALRSAWLFTYLWASLHITLRSFDETRTTTKSVYYYYDYSFSSGFDYPVCFTTSYHDIIYYILHSLIAHYPLIISTIHHQNPHHHHRTLSPRSTFSTCIDRQRISSSFAIRFRCLHTPHSSRRVSSTLVRILSLFFRFDSLSIDLIPTQLELHAHHHHTVLFDLFYYSCSCNSLKVETSIHPSILLLCLSRRRGMRIRRRQQQQQNLALAARNILPASLGSVTRSAR